MKRLWIVVFPLIVLLSAWALEKGEVNGKEQANLALISSETVTKNDLDRTKITTALLKQALENYHYNAIKINDDLSKKAFKEYLKKLDYSRQFLLQSDLDELEKYQDKMDDEINSGVLTSMMAAQKLINVRIKLAERYRQEFFKTKFDYTIKESIETDPEKREFLKTEKESKDRWRKIFKYSVVSRYYALAEEQKDDEKKSKTEDVKKVKKKKANGKPKEILTDAQLWDKAYDAIDKRYKKYFQRLLEETYDDHLDKYLNAITAIYDPHTNFMPPRKKEDFDIDISGSLEGIGAVLSEDGNNIKVDSIVPGGAAWRQKELEVDDLILMVGQGKEEAISLEDMNVDEAVRYIRGKKGTEVRLTVKKSDGSHKVIPITRDVVRITESFAKSSVITYKGLDKKIGYIYLPKFYRNFSDATARNCTEDVKREVVRLKKLSVDGIILDLRNNGGGALEDAKLMSGLFIEKGPIVQVRDHAGQLEVYEDTDPEIVYNGPLIVMINRFSASASEILAGALQDYKRAIIVGGEFSHGKGTVQAVLGLNNSTIFSEDIGALKITIQKFYRVTGASTQFKGITPDIIIPDPAAYAKTREQDLDGALKWDSIKTVNFTQHNDKKIILSTLLKRSEERVSKNPRMKKIIESVAYLTKKRDETNYPLDVESIQKIEDENKNFSEKMKLDEKDESVVVSHFEESLKENQNISKSEEKMWEEDFENKKKDWVEGLQKDTGLEEAIFVLDDMVRMEKGEKFRDVSEYH